MAGVNSVKKNSNNYNGEKTANLQDYEWLVKQNVWMKLGHQYQKINRLR